MSESSQVPALSMDDDAGYDKQFVTFSVEGEMFAVPMGPVQEIIRVPEVARLPLAPASLDGLANLRGRVLPIVNLRKLFGCAQRANDDASRAVVIQLGQPLGFVVDRVASVLSVEPSEVESASSIQSIVKADYLTGVIKRTNADGQPEMLMVLDFAKLVEKEFSSLQRSVERVASVAAQSSQAQEDVNALASDEIRLVSFSVSGQEYGIEIADVQEIVQVPERITALPTAAHHVLGLISLRQRLLPLVSLRALFGLPYEALSENHRIVVVTLPGSMTVGLVTDSVKEVLSVSRRQVEPIPGVLAQGSSMQEFSGICRLEGGKRLLSVIATQKLLGLQGVQEALQMAAAHGETEQGDGMSSFQEGNASIEEDMQVVIFRLGAEEFGVPIMSVQEIVRVPELLTRVPKTPAFVEGVINLRGTVLPVMDQRTRLGLPAIERNDRQRIMVYLMGSLRTGFIVDSVAEVLRIPRAQVAPAPELSTDQGRLVTHVAKLDGDKRLVMLLDPAHLLEGQEIQEVAMLAQGEGLYQEA